RLVAVAPTTNGRGKGCELGPHFQVDAKAGAEDNDVGIQWALIRVEADRSVGIQLCGIHPGMGVEEGVGEFGDPQGAALGRGHLLTVDVMAYSPFPVVGKLPETMRHAGTARSLGLIHTRNLGAAGEQMDFCRTVLKCCGGTIHGRSAYADHHHPLAIESVPRPKVRGMKAPLGWKLRRPFGHPRATQTVAASCQDHTPCKHLNGFVGFQLTERNTAIAVSGRFDPLGTHAIVDGDARYALEPVKILRPLRPWDFVQRLPGLFPELCSEPGSESQTGNTQSGAC